jgi:hypothetical protein
MQNTLTRAGLVRDTPLHVHLPKLEANVGLQPRRFR